VAVQLGKSETQGMLGMETHMAELAGAMRKGNNNHKRMEIIKNDGDVSTRIVLAMGETWFVGRREETARVL
jgi:hypothetical protein